MTGARGADRILGVVLAGGLARRMHGQDKGLLPLAGSPIISRVIARARPQVARLILNTNGDPARFFDLGLDIVADTVPGFAGPLAGLLAAMRWADAHDPRLTHVATFAADTPFVPLDLVARLDAALSATPGAAVAIARSPAGIQPVFALVPVTLADRLAADLAAGAARRVLAWLHQSPVAHADFVEEAGRDPFFNINTPEDLAAAEILAAADPGERTAISFDERRDLDPPADQERIRDQP